MKKLLLIPIIALAFVPTLLTNHYSLTTAAVGGFPDDYCDGLSVSGAIHGHEPAITAKAAFLMEANSGKVLFQHNADKQLPIASMVKVMTLAICYDELDAGNITLDQKVMVSREAGGMGGSQAFLDFDNEYPVEELIKSIVIASANDSCVAMAELIAGSESEFVNRMNTLAQTLGMKDTNYANCTGLPAPGAHSTAADMAKVYAHIMKSPHFATNNKVWMYDLTHPSGRVTGLTNTNKHSRFFNGCCGGKTGFTNEAGHCITVSATRGEMRPVAVIIGASDSKTRFAESAALMNFAFNGFENKLVIPADKSVGQIKLKSAMDDKVDVYPARNFFDLVKKGDKGEPTITIEINETAKAPITATDSVGKATITRGGQTVGEIDLVTNTDIESLTYWGSVKKTVRTFRLF